VQVVIVRVDRQHLLFSAGADSVGSSVAAWGESENGQRGQKGIDVAKNTDLISPLEGLTVWSELTRRHATPAHEGVTEARRLAETQGFGDAVDR